MQGSLSIKFLYQKFAFKNEAIEPATSTNLTRKTVKKVKECSNKNYKLYSKRVCNWRLIEFTINITYVPAFLICSVKEN